MTLGDAEVVSQMWQAFLAGDVEAAWSHFDRDVEWDGTNLPDGRVGFGRQAVLDHVAAWADTWDDWTVEIKQVVEADGDRVLLFMREHGTSKSGLNIDEVHAEVYDMREGKIVRRKGYSDPQEAVTAVGLPSKTWKE